jgi:hypothetical protein
MLVFGDAGNVCLRVFKGKYFLGDKLGKVTGAAMRLGLAVRDFF